MTAKGRRGVTAQLDRAAEACARDGAELTELRRSVLGLVLEADGPVTAYQLLDRLRKIRKGAVPPTVYRALEFLLEHGLIHRLERLNAFIPCAETGHRHVAQFLICRECGSVAEIEDQAAARALVHAAERKGFRARDTVVEIEGTCAACARAA
ncbi:MAG: transcriptional repressor [Alphaproteobacteria bacterium]|nr:transcriptional repressor [Alphaproteobacteria bacterium]MDE1930559.1 transcriptional repressor [Alphaproteobacteria bacterium]